jgi:NTE family protein
MFSDKTLHNVQMAKAITYHLRFIDELYHAIEDRFDLENKKDKEKFEKIRAKYKKIAEQHGAEIKTVYHITRVYITLRECRFLEECDKGFY